MKKEVQRINIILRHAENIKDFLSDITEEEWGKNKEKQYASMYSLMAISENVKELLKMDIWADNSSCTKSLLHRRLFYSPSSIPPEDFACWYR